MSTAADSEQIDAAAARLDAAAGQAPAADDGVVLLQASTLRPQPVTWLWPDWLALGKLHVLAGAPGQGKTTLALAFAATISTGGRWPDRSRCEPGSVLIWSGEDDPADTLLPRLIAMGADASRIYFISGTRVAGKYEPFDPARDLVELAAQALEIGTVRLLVVDPVVSVVSGDSHKNGEVRRALQPLVALASILDAAVLGISHFTKGGAGREPVERVTGSLAFGAVARVVMCTVKAKGEGGDEQRVLARAKSNIGPDDGGVVYRIVQADLPAHPGITASRIEWGEPVTGSARELLAEAEAFDEGARSEPEGAEESLRRILGHDLVPSRRVSAQMKSEGYSDKAIRRARERIGVIVRRTGFGKDMASCWKLPDGAFVPCDDIAAHSCPAKTWAGMGTRADSQGTNGTALTGDDRLEGLQDH